MRTYFSALLLFSCIATSVLGQEKTIFREWNEVLLEAIRNDFARPTVHARNLFHASSLMYDTYALFDEDLETLYFGKDFDGNAIIFDSSAIVFPQDIEQRDSIITVIVSYAMARFLEHRFELSPGLRRVDSLSRNLMQKYGLNIDFFSVNYAEGNYAALGNYMAAELLRHARIDGSNERANYRNIVYRPFNNPLNVQSYGSTGVIDPNRWQELTLTTFIDQAGNVIPGSTQPFLGAEWGRVTPFAMGEEALTKRRRDSLNYDWWIYHDPGPPPYITPEGDGGTEAFRNTFLTTLLWSAQMDPRDTLRWDISPAGMGNTPIDLYPDDFNDYNSFYNLIEGRHSELMRTINPITGRAYEPNFVKRGDYTRVIAEYWADGPNSETPPGHWFVILNQVMDHPLFVPKWYGEGESLSQLEYEARAYLTLGGAVHDAAISIWSIKGYYDYTRPVMAIRYMGSRGQCTDPSLPNYHVHGLPLIPGYIEVIQPGDPLVGTRGERLGQIKVRTWRGHNFVADPTVDIAGVGWIPVGEWWPYQLISFVTPPFAGYPSGHSGFSRAAAEVLTAMTGDEYFPGGIGEFRFKKYDYLEFEAGPSEDITLQYATYRDASDHTSLSRIWGGIHPPVDDLVSRLIGIKVAESTLKKVNSLFNFVSVSTEEFIGNSQERLFIFPNPASPSDELTVRMDGLSSRAFIEIYSPNGARIHAREVSTTDDHRMSLAGYAHGLHLVILTSGVTRRLEKLLITR